MFVIWSQLEISLKMEDHMSNRLANIKIMREAGKNLVHPRYGISTNKKNQVEIDFEPHEGDFLEVSDKLRCRVRSVTYNLDGSVFIVASLSPNDFDVAARQAKEKKGCFASGWQVYGV